MEKPLIDIQNATENFKAQRRKHEQAYGTEFVMPSASTALFAATGLADIH